jgi:uncharacterized membrane protein
MAAANAYAAELLKLSVPAYAASKKIMRREESEHVLNIMEKDIMDWVVNYMGKIK